MRLGFVQKVHQTRSKGDPSGLKTHQTRSKSNKSKVTTNNTIKAGDSSPRNNEDVFCDDFESLFKNPTKNGTIKCTNKFVPRFNRFFGKHLPLVKRFVKDYQARKPVMIKMDQKRIDVVNRNHVVLIEHYGVWFQVYMKCCLKMQRDVLVGSRVVYSMN
jgi:hypothetical protein